MVIASGAIVACVNDVLPEIKKKMESQKNLLSLIHSAAF